MGACGPPSGRAGTPRDRRQRNGNPDIVQNGQHANRGCRSLERRASRRLTQQKNRREARCETRAKKQLRKFSPEAPGRGVTRNVRTGTNAERTEHLHAKPETKTIEPNTSHHKANKTRKWFLVVASDDCQWFLVVKDDS